MYLLRIFSGVSWAGMNFSSVQHNDRDKCVSHTFIFYVCSCCVSLTMFSIILLQSLQVIAEVSPILTCFHLDQDAFWGAVLKKVKFGLSERGRLGKLRFSFPISYRLRATWW